MIIKAAKTSKGIGEKQTLRRGGFKQLSDYLRGQSNNAGENESCNFIASNTCLKDINDFCIMGNRIAAPFRGGKNPLKYPIEHIVIAPRPGDILTPEMLMEKLPELLEALTDEKGRSYANCPWMLVQHMKFQKTTGRAEPHYHLAIVRVDDKGQIPNPRADKICFEKAQEFARHFGFKPSFNQADADRHTQQADHLARLWDESKGITPAERLKKFEQGGFSAARNDKRNEVVFVDRYGKPHSLHRIPAIKKAGMKQADISAAFGFDKEKIAALPTVSHISTSIKREKNAAKRRHRSLVRYFAKYNRETNRLIARVCGNALSPMRGGHSVDDQWKISLPLLWTVIAWGISRSGTRDELQPLHADAGKPAKPVNELPEFKPKRKRAGIGWWVAARANNVFKALLLAGLGIDVAQAAADLIWEEEEQRQAAEQRYLDELNGWPPKRSEVMPGNPASHNKK